MVMIVPGLFGSAFGTYLMRQFFLTLPVELEEAAILDGCGIWQTYWRVLLPHARPAVMVLAVLTWMTVWNDFLWPLVMIQRDDISTLTLGLVRLQGQYHTNWPILMAAAILIGGADAGGLRVRAEGVRARDRIVRDGWAVKRSMPISGGRAVSTATAESFPHANITAARYLAAAIGHGPPPGSTPSPGVAA